MRMNVYLTTAKRVIKYAYPTILSLFENNKDSEIYLYLVSEDLEPVDIPYELQLAAEYGNHIEILRFNEEMARGRIVCADEKHWPLGTLACYWLFHVLLPSDMDRIMAVESDTVVTGSLAEFYSTDLTGYYAACPDPDHKPESHRKIMEKLDGDVLSFVVSVYDVDAIRRDFTLDDILNTDREAVKKIGASQQELTFGMLFKGKIKFLPANKLCIEENRQSMRNLGYDYLKSCEKDCRILHFSSYTDKGKPWNPVCIMPGFYEWWRYAKDCPYEKDYYLEQWKSYDRRAAEVEKIKKNVTYRNVLLAALVLFVILLCVCVLCLRLPAWYLLGIPGLLGVSFGGALLLRKFLMR